MPNFAFYSTDIDPTTDPANADPAPEILVVLDQVPILGNAAYDLMAGEIGRGSVIQTLGGVVVQDFGVVDGDQRISFSDTDALSAETVADLRTIHETADGEYFFTDGCDIWRVRFARPGGFRYRRNLFWAQHSQEIYSYEINLIVMASLHPEIADCGLSLETVEGLFGGADCKLPLEAAAGLIADCKLPLEAAAWFTEDPKLPLEAAAAFIADCKFPLEAAAGLIADCKLPLEAAAEITEDPKLSLEAAAEVIEDSRLSLEAVVPFVFTVKTTGVDETFSLPLEASGTYDFNVDWGDESSDHITVWNDAAVTHTYASADTYEITITGTIFGWSFSNGGDKTKIYEIKSWGPLQLGNTGLHFYGCANLTVTAIDVLDLTGTTALNDVFGNIGAGLTAIPSINSWDVSSITSIIGLVAWDSNLEIEVSSWNSSSITKTTHAFHSTKINCDFSSWDMSSVTDARYMFKDCTNFDQDLSSWDITSLVYAAGFLNGGTLSTANYDALLIGWEAQDENPNVDIDFGGSKYTGGGVAATARAALVASGWTITDGGEA